MVINGAINKKMILTIKILNRCVKSPLSLPESYGYLVHNNTDCKSDISFSVLHLQRPVLKGGVLEMDFTIQIRLHQILAL